MMGEEGGKVCRLVDRIRVGGGFGRMNEGYLMGKRDRVRVGGRKEFERFGIVLEG